jgi:hypothetical protein
MMMRTTIELIFQSQKRGSLDCVVPILEKTWTGLVCNYIVTGKNRVLEEMKVDLNCLKEQDPGRFCSKLRKANG